MKIVLVLILLVYRLYRKKRKIDVPMSTRINRSQSTFDHLCNMVSYGLKVYLHRLPDDAPRQSDQLKTILAVAELPMA